MQLCRQFWFHLLRFQYIHLQDLFLKPNTINAHLIEFVVLTALRDNVVNSASAATLSRDRLHVSLENPLILPRTVLYCYSLLFLVFGVKSVNYGILFTFIVLGGGGYFKTCMVTIIQLFARLHAISDGQDDVYFVKATLAKL